MPDIQANGIRIYYERAGEGPAVLFISGTGGDLRNRPNVFDSPLARAFDVIAYDQRGLGQSEKPRADYHMSDYADDAAGLLTALGIDRIAVMGASFGGMVAQELALRHPERVQALVLACTSAGGAGGASFPLQTLESLPPAERAARHLALSDLRRDEAWQAANPERWQQLVDMALAARRADRDEDGARRQLAARAEHDTFARLGRLEMPVLLAGGEYDGVAPKANMEAMAGQIGQAELKFFAGGHLFLAQDKAAYPFIIQWLKESSEKFGR